MPPMPMIESAEPTRSIDRSPVYRTSFSSGAPMRTTAITSASSRKPTRQERYVVIAPPSRGPTAAAIAAAAPTSA